MFKKMVVFVIFSSNSNIIQSWCVKNNQKNIFIVAKWLTYDADKSIMM